MNEKSNASVVIIHGVVRRESTHRWMKQLQAHLLKAGIPDVRLFFWSGRASISAIENAGKDLADNMMTWFGGEKEEHSRVLRVFGKSSGALVFRSALTHLANRSIVFPFDLLLQVATPNPPVTESTLSLVKRVVNIYSRDDWFLRFFLKVGPFKRYSQILEMKGANNYPDIKNIEIPNIGHDKFNWNIIIRDGIWAGKSLYDIYSRILCE